MIILINIGLNIVINFKEREREKEKIQGDILKICIEKVIVLVLFYVFMVRYCGLYQSLFERYVYIENVLFYSIEMFENFCSFSILWLRMKVEEYLK